MENNPLESFTLPARAVIVGGMLLAAGGTWAYIAWTAGGLPEGSYSLLLWVVPAFAAAGVFVWLGLWALKLGGIPIRRGQRPGHAEQAKEEPSDRDRP